MRRVTGKLGVALADHAGVIKLGGIVYAALNADQKTYAGPNPALPVLLGSVTDADTAQKALGSGHNVALTDARDAKVEVLYDYLADELVFVQRLANAALTPAAATALITGAGFEIIIPGVRHPTLLTLTNIAPAGTVHCVVSRILLIGGKTSKRVTINWQYSLDNGVTWVDVKSTPLVQTDIPNLPLLKPVQVRASATISKVTGAWCAAASIVVH